MRYDGHTRKPRRLGKMARRRQIRKRRKLALDVRVRRALESQ